MSHNGKQTSVDSSPEAAAAHRDRAIAAALERVFRRGGWYAGPKPGPADTDRRTHDLVFHMTDWRDDLARLAELYSDPDAHDAKAWEDGVVQFLLHATGHIAAAARIMDMQAIEFADPGPPPAAPRAPRKPRRRAATATR